MKIKAEIEVTFDEDEFDDSAIDAVEIRDAIGDAVSACGRYRNYCQRQSKETKN